MAVQYSIQKMVSDGTLSTIALGIQYLQRNDIYIRIAGEETPQSGAPSGYTWSFVNNTTLKILPVVPNGVEVVVYRRTDIDAMYNIYSQNAQFDEATIDENNQQLLYIAQEYLEQGIPGAGVDTVGFLRDDGINTYYRIKRTDGSYSDEFAVPSVGSSVNVLVREALRRSCAEAGYNLVLGSFQIGFALTSKKDVALDESSGKVFSGLVGTYPAGVSTIGFTDRSNDTLRGNLLLNYTGIRNYSGPSGVLRCYGRNNIFDNAHGEFYFDPSDTTSADNDCTILVDVSGRRWKRKYNVLDGVLVDWAGADPSGASNSDIAFSNAVSAGHGIRVRGKYVVNSPVIITANAGFFIKGTSRQTDSITKTNLSAPNITRTYGGTVFNYNTPCIFAFVANNESYVRHVFVENLSTIGLAGDLTQVHFFAPKASYCAFDGVLSTHGKSFWESTVNGFINSFENVRTALMSKHVKVVNSNAYTLTNFYANGTPPGGDSVAYEFIDTNAAFLSCDCDGLNIGWVSDGHSNLEVVGSNSEARLRIFNSRGDSSINIHGGRHALSVNRPQQALEATPYRAEDSSRINVVGAKAHKFIFDATPSNKFLAIAGDSAKVCMSDMAMNVGTESAAEPFSTNDILTVGAGKISISAGGEIISKVITSSTPELLDTTITKRIQKVVDFSSGTAQTVLTLSGIAYNQMVLASAEILYRSTGNNGLGSVGGLATCKLAASSREQNTSNINVEAVGISPNAGSASVTFTTVNSGASLTIVATASSTAVGVCSFSMLVSAVLVSANRVASKISVS